jgi:hypothetical protein
MLFDSILPTIELHSKLELIPSNLVAALSQAQLSAYLGFRHAFLTKLNHCVCVYFVYVFSCVYVAALRRADPPS